MKYIAFLPFKSVLKHIYHVYRYMLSAWGIVTRPLFILETPDSIFSFLITSSITYHQRSSFYSLISITAFFLYILTLCWDTNNYRNYAFLVIGKDTLNAGVIN